MEKAAFDSGEWEIYEANLRPSLGPQKQDSENRNLEPMRCTHTCVCVCTRACGHEHVGKRMGWTFMERKRAQVTEWDESLLSTLQICPSVLEQLPGHFLNLI